MTTSPSVASQGFGTQRQGKFSKLAVGRMFQGQNIRSGSA
jgi:hypothetical protein